MRRGYLRPWVVALVLLPTASVLAADTVLQLGMGDVFVVQDSGATDRLRVDETTGAVVIGNVDIDGGTIDGVAIGGPANAGDIWYDNGASIVRLSPGTSGRYLQTRGVGLSPIWNDAAATSSVLFHYAGAVDSCGGSVGEVIAGQLNNHASLPRCRFLEVTSTAMQTVLQGKFVKTAGVNTVRIHALLWSNTTSQTNQVMVIIGGASNTTFVSNVTSPTWGALRDINVSSLINGTTYDITVRMQGNSPVEASRMGALILTRSS